METMHSLLERIPQVGLVEWIGVNPSRRQAMTTLHAVVARIEDGLQGDHHAKRASSRRQVTLVQHEHLPVIASLVGRSQVEANLLRRNIAVRGINLLALKDRRFRIGGVILAGSGTCDPCSRMEEALGPGGWNAMRGHGGITARVVVDGVIRVGDRIEVVPYE
jgi:MOSC domain-containing protein YiiM